MRAWSDYLNTLQQQDTPGRNLTEEEINNLSPEQKFQLEKLKEEATRQSKE